MPLYNNPDPGPDLRVGGGRAEAGHPAVRARRPPRRQLARLGRSEVKELGLRLQDQPQGKRRGGEGRELKAAIS